MVWVARDVREFLQQSKRDNNVPSEHMHQELVCVKIDRGLINGIIEELDELGTIVSLVIGVIIN